VEIIHRLGSFIVDKVIYVYDSGDYLNKVQPERVSYAQEPVEVRAGWDTIEEFILED